MSVKLMTETSRWDLLSTSSSVKEGREGRQRRRERERGGQWREEEGRGEEGKGEGKERRDQGTSPQKKFPCLPDMNLMETVR